MKIALSMRVCIKEEYDEPRNAVSFDWIKTLFSLDVLPILIPNNVESSDLFFDNLDFDGLILTGGDDIRIAPNDRILSGVEDPFAARDLTEYLLLEKAILKKIPVIGICRGLQLINLYFGGAVVEDLKKMGVPDCHVGVEHEVEVVNEEFFKLLGKKRFLVNSYHNQGVDLDNLASPLQPFALAEDGIVVEGFNHRTLPILGIMWHPERENPLRKETRLILNKFLQ